jgi:hypothetical protein
MADRPPRESTQYLTMGLGIGAVGAVGALVGAAACPVCIVATPALLGVGLYKRWKEHAEARHAEASGVRDSSEGSEP